jgi:glycosyltransferase involved in cell wall biosynthesis
VKYPISVYLIAGNEEEYIERCLKSFAPIAKEMVVCISRGSATPDKTEEIASGLGAKIVHYQNQRTDWPHIDDFATARNTALNACSNEWCLWVDADDVMAEDGAKVVEEAIDLAVEKDAHLVALKYNVDNAGLIPLREEISKRGTCNWKNRVHEMLVTKEPNKTIGVDKIFRIHKPHGYKAKSAERNFNILADTLSTAPNALYYQAQEYFLSNQMDKCIESSLRALTFSELEDTLRYDVLCNLGRCVPDNERLSYLGQAVALQPDRREAYFYIANHWAGKGNWIKTYGSARACMTLHRPKTHYWNLVEAIYNWQAMDLYETASVCVGETAEAEKIKKMRPAPKISIIHATKGRPQIAWQRRWQWLSLAQKPLEVEWLFMVDHDEAVDYTPHQAIRVNPGGIVNAWNAGAKLAKGEIIIQMSDDWTPPRHWDALISTAMGDTTEEKVLAVSDGLRTDKLLCMAILTQSRLKKQGGYMFHPDYQESDGIYGDNEHTDKAYEDQVIVEARHIQFKHENPMFTGGNPDELLKNHNKPEHYQKGKAIYEKRKANNWM